MARHTTLRSIVVNVLRKRGIQPPAINAASIQGLLNELQLNIIDMLFTTRSWRPSARACHPITASLSRSTPVLHAYEIYDGPSLE